jgi:hypothetical protein
MSISELLGRLVEPPEDIGGIKLHEFGKLSNQPPHLRASDGENPHRSLEAMPYSPTSMKC